LTERHALVTGAGSGIGRGIACGLARRGFRLSLVGRREDRLAETRELVRQLGAVAEGFPADLSDVGALAALVERVESRGGPVDVLVNNAAAMEPGPLAGLDGDTLRRTMTTNLVAPMELTRLLRDGLAARSGTVAFVSSLAAELPMPDLSLYCASKAGLGAWAESVRFELERNGVHVLVVMPPLTRTAMLSGVPEAAGIPWLHMASAERVGESIAAAVVRRTRRRFGWSNGLALFAQAVAPWLVRAVLQSQAPRFRRAFGAGRRGEPTA